MCNIFRTRGKCVDQNHFGKYMKIKYPFMAQTFFTGR